MNLGIDIGNVIVQAATDTDNIGQKDSFDEIARWQEVPKAIETITKLVPMFSRVWLISKCYENMQKRSRKWLDQMNFFTRTKIQRERLLFCYERRAKGIICEGLDVGCFIDDRYDVLESIWNSMEHQPIMGRGPGEGPILIQFGASELRMVKEPFPLTACETWDEVWDLLTGEEFIL